MKNLPVLLLMLCAVTIAVVFYSRIAAARKEVAKELGPAMKRIQPYLQNGSTIGLWNTTAHNELLPRCRFLLSPVLIEPYSPGQVADTVLAVATKGDKVSEGIIARVASGSVLQQFVDSTFSYTLLYLPEGMPRQAGQ